MYYMLASKSSQGLFLHFQRSLWERQSKMLRKEHFHHSQCKTKTLPISSFLCSSWVFLFQVGLDGKTALNQESYLAQSMADAGIPIRFVQLSAQNQACDTLKMFRSWQCNSCHFYCVPQTGNFSIIARKGEESFFLILYYSLCHCNF